MLADVAEDQRGYGRIEITRDEIGRDFVRQVAPAAHHALLHGPRIRSDAQHLEIVIRFEDHNIGSAQVDAKRFSDIPEVGRNRDLYAATAERVAHGIHRIVRDRETGNIEIPDGKRPARSEYFHGRSVAFPIDGLRGAVRHINRNPPASFSRQGSETADMIAMLVRHQNRVQIVNAFADGREALRDFAPAQARVDQDPGSLACDEGRVPRTAARQYADFYDGILRLAKPEVPAL